MSTENRNAYELLAIINRRLKARKTKSKEEIKKVLDDMQSDDYEHLVKIYNKYE